jgi:hypothetical protein
MTKSQIIPLLIYVTIAFLYFWFTAKFKKGWTHKCVPVKGGKLNVLLVIAIFFIILIFLVKRAIS